MTFEDAYRLHGVAACRELVALQSAGTHDMRLRLREKEITHEAIVELADMLDELKSSVETFVKGVDR